MFSRNVQGSAPTDSQVKTQMEAWGFGANAVGLNDGERAGIETYFPGNTSWRDAMLLRPGFQVVKTGLSSSAFEREIDAVLAESR